MIKVKKTPKIVTTTNDGKSNGFLLPIINVHDGFVDKEQWPQQVYCTVVEPGMVKGPHLHHKRWGLFTCIKGDVKIVVRTDSGYEEHFTGESYEFQTIQVPAGIPAAIQNVGSSDAYLLNMPSPSWHVDDQDDWDVAFEDYDFSAKS